jgi:hypothetical protein
MSFRNAIVALIPGVVLCDMCPICNPETQGAVAGWGRSYAKNFIRGVQQIQLRTEGSENGDLGTAAP